MSVLFVSLVEDRLLRLKVLGPGGGGDPMPADIGDTGDVDGEGAPQGLSWSYELDFGALIAALAGGDPPDAADTDAADAVAGPGAGTPAPGSAEEEAAQEAILDELAELDARAAAEGRVD